MSEPQHIPDRALTHFDRAVGFVSRIGDFTTLSLVVMTGVFVFMRYILDSPFQGTEDMLGLTLVVTVACSLAHGGRIGAHVAVDVMGMVGGRKVTTPDGVAAP